MTTISIEQEAYFLRQAALHACGKALVARHYEMDASPTIWKNTSENRAEEQLWLSSIQYEGRNKTSLRDRRIAIAGFIAEEMEREGSPDESCVDSLYGPIADWLGDEFEESDEMSRSEWDILTSCKDRDVHAVCMILKRNWKALLEESNFLTVEAAKYGSSTTTSWMRSQGLDAYAD